MKNQVVIDTGDPKNAIARIEEVLADLKKQAEDVWPTEGDLTYRITDTGEIDSWMYLSTYPDRLRIAQGNLFRTRAEAEKERDRRAIRVKMQAYTKGFVPGWRNPHQEKYCVEREYSPERWHIGNWSSYRNLDAMYFRTREDAQACIDALGDEMMVLL